MTTMIPFPVLEQLATQHEQGKKIVLVTGVFDLLHEEHRKFLQKAKNAGDFLVVAIESDARVKKIKGEGRPVWNQEKRQKEVQALSGVDAVFILPEDFNAPEQRELLIATIRPAILAISSHSPHQDKKKAIIEKYGGALQVVHEHNPAVSTTLLLKDQ